jgi:hypothetical protein
MRAKRILTMILGVFVIVALVTIARQAIHSAPRNDRPVAASAVPLADSAPPAPILAQTTSTAVAASSVEAAPVPPVQQSRVAPANEASSGAVAKVRSTPATRESEPPQRATPQSHVRKIVATYFHGNIRCVTCRKIEAYSREAVHDAFGPEIEAGKVEFRAVNVEEDANRHCIQDYQLVTRTLVVTEEVDGAVKRWAKLDNVWGLVGDRTAFFRYVQGGVRDYLETPQ